MPRLRVIEYRDPHIKRLTGDEVLAVFAAYLQFAGGYERPMPVSPLCPSDNVGPLAIVVAVNDHATGALPLSIV